MARRGRQLVTFAVSAAIVFPVVADRDSFPLSTYPMYSRVRSNEVAFATANGLDASGGRHRLSLSIIGASDDPLIVAGELRAAIAEGRANDRCASIASRASGEDGLVAVEVVIERHDVVALATGRPSLVDRRVHEHCEIEIST
jgi:hypothetical protein